MGYNVHALRATRFSRSSEQTLWHLAFVWNGFDSFSSNGSIDIGANHGPLAPGHRSGNTSLIQTLAPPLPSRPLNTSFKSTLNTC